MYTCILMFIFLNVSANAQLKNTMDRIYQDHLKCLDSGINMLGCSRKYYLEMDSMLNLTYKKLRTTLNETEKSTLKEEQLKWLKERDAYFETQNRIFNDKVNSGEWGNDMYMVTFDNKADFVRKRVLEIIKRVE